jgi:anti-anti-sigma regulatory factor
VKVDAWIVLPFPCALISSGRRERRKKLLRELRATGSHIILDFSNCRTLDHEDIDLLLRCVAQVVGRDKQVVFAADSNAIRALLEVTRISSLVPIFNSVEEALERLKIAVPNIVEELQTCQSHAWSA